MKTIFFILAFMLVNTCLQSQITPDNIYDGAIRFAYLEGENYYSVDYVNNECSVYGLDHSLKQKISINIPAEWYLYDVSFLSSKIFNDDDQTEFLVVFYKYVADSDTTGHYEYYTRVVSENGNVLLDVPGGGYSTIFSTVENKLKLMVNIYDFSFSVYIAQTNIYNLPGEAASSVNEIPEITLMNAYPNPAGSETRIPYKLSTSDGKAMLILTNLNGREVLRMPVENKSGELIMQTGNLAAGQYIYYLINNRGQTAARKLIVR